MYSNDIIKQEAAKAAFGAMLNQEDITTLHTNSTKQA